MSCYFGPDVLSAENIKGREESSARDFWLTLQVSTV